MSKEEIALYLTCKIIIDLRLVDVVGHRKTSVGLTWSWPTTPTSLLPFARQPYVYCTIIVRRKNGSYRHRTLQVATRLQTKLCVTPSTGRSNVCLSHVAPSVTSTRFLTLQSATGATTGITRNTRTKHVRSLWLGLYSVLLRQPNNLQKGRNVKIHSFTMFHLFGIEHLSLYVEV